MNTLSLGDLRAESDYAGARVELVGYAKISAPAPACSRQGAVR
ncbi:hypothetical protein ABZY03_00465 [Streptomyces klenkii]